MRKITLLGLVMIASSTLFAQTPSYTWDGAQPIQVWDLVTPNWMDDNFPIPIPATFVDNSIANFTDVSTFVGNDTIKALGVFHLIGMNVNATRNYIIRQTTAADSLVGAGTFVKDGTGDLVMDIRNNMKGGTSIKNGRMKMEKQTSANIFGSSLTFNGGIANFATTTASTYPSITLPVTIPTGVTANVELSRYSYWSSPISGNGDLHIFAGGDRTYLGQKNVQPVWTNFKGNVTVDKYVMTGVTPGFSGLILNTNKTYKDSLVNGFGVDSTFYNRKFTLGNGVTIGAESGNRAYCVGELNSTDSTSLLAGYYKDSTTPKIFYMVGGLNSNVVYPGRIGFIGVKLYNQTGIIKTGTGTYTFTNNNNQITGGIDIRNGRVLINDKNIKGNKNGGCGYTVSVKGQGILGGTGRIGGTVDVYGTLQPGADGIGTLTISDSITANPISVYGTPFKAYSFTYNSPTATGVVMSLQNGGTRTADLILRQGSVSEFEIANANSYDKVVLSGSVRFSKDVVSAAKPKLKIKLAPGYSVKNGDQFEIIKAKSLDVANSDGFDIEYPTQTGINWSVTKADTLKLAKETLTFTNHVVTKTNTDSVVISVVVPDTMRYTYKVIVTANTQTAVENTLDNNTISVYPNPTKGEVTISSSDADITTVEILNLQGQSILKRDVRSAKANIKLDNYAAGVYYTKITTAKGTKVQKLLIQ